MKENDISPAMERKHLFIEKLKNTKAFTLAEALVTILILLLVSGIVAAGIPAAMRAYDKVVITANAEVLLSTGMTALRNELGTARDIKVDGSTISYYNENRGTQSAISIDSGDGKKNDVMLQRYYTDNMIIDYSDLPDGSKEGEADIKQYYNKAEKLVSDQASDKKGDKMLHLTYTGVSYSDGIVTFSNLEVKKDNGGSTPASRSTYSVRIIRD